MKTNATNDVLIWIQAAIPPKPNGHINRPRAAEQLGISERTLQRWIADPERMPLEAKLRMRQLAILRGRGRILWPRPAPSVFEAEAKLADYAIRAVADITDDIDLDFWKGPKENRLEPHQLTLIHFPHAHVHAITIAQDRKAVQRLQRKGAVATETRMLDNYWQAQAVKYTMLTQLRSRRCIVPSTVIPLSRTHTWRELPHHTA